MGRNVMSATQTTSLWVDRLAVALRSWAGPAAAFEVVQTHRQDHLTGVLTYGRRRWFVKAYDPHSVADLRTECRAYQRFTARGLVPRMHHVDLEGRFLVTDLIDGGRLGVLTGSRLRSALQTVPDLYTALTTGSPGAPPSHEAYWSAWTAIGSTAQHPDLPDPDQVLQITSTMAALHVHGDFQPSNILMAGDRPVAVDLESYGPDIPALDVARLAYNPVLDLEAGERDALAWQMLDRLHFHGAPRTSARGLAACCVLWAVTCARYFQGVLRDQPDAAQHSPEVKVLATAPLQLASRLWHQEV